MTKNAHPLRTAVVAGSTRPVRLARSVADWVVADPNPDLQLTVIDLVDLDLPLLDEPAPAASGDYARESTRAWSQLVEQFDAFVLVTPEYNHSTSAALKNALDHLYAEWRDKPVAFVGYGVEGGGRAVEHLRTICAELGMAGIGPQVSLRLGEDFTERQCMPSDRATEARARMLGQLSRWATVLRPLRPTGVPSIGDRPNVDRAELRPAAAAAVNELVAELQAGLDQVDAERYDRPFAGDILWGSPYGRILTGIDRLSEAHRSLMADGAAPASRYELVALSAPVPEVVIAHVRRSALADGGFSEMALYVLVAREGQWWLAAGQNTPIADPAAQ